MIRGLGKPEPLRYELSGCWSALNSATINIGLLQSVCDPSAGRSASRGRYCR
ncbi:MAG: type II toxin-antitoxin system YoeB family toxin [Acidobacteriia bacterium]|nr:type II toxin-antitoxin system YoeB family toxin [Terriglobia bacterium]